MKKITALILAVLMLVATFGCKNKENEAAGTSSQPEITTEPEVTTEPVKTTVEFARGNACEYEFVYSDADYSTILVNEILAFRMDLRRTAKDGTFKMNKFGNSNTVAEAEKEILVGVTNREESTSLYSAISENRFGIEVTENKIVIAAKRDRVMKDAIAYFTENYLVKNEEGNIVMNIGRYISEEITYSISPMISNKQGFSTVHEYLYDIPATGNNRIMQGGCSDGKNMYFCMINSEKPQYAYICKYDIATNKYVKKSELLDTDHSNDMTYNSKTNELIVLHNSPRNSLLSILDPETLEIKRRVTVSYNMFCIDYQPERDVYVIGISGGQNFAVLDANFKLDRTYIPTGSRFEVESTGYVTQGVVCDKDYIYFVQYKENVIMVYDWAGKFVNKIPLSIPSNTEPENISIVEDTFYIGCNNSSWTGGVLYRVHLVVPEK